MRQPGVWMAATAWLLALAGLVGGSALLGAKADPLLMIVLAQTAAALPVLLLLIWHRPAALGLGPASWRSNVLGLGLGPVAIGASMIGFGVMFLLVGPPPANQPVEQVIGALDARFGLVGLILLAAVLPGLVEEALFRGVILTGLRSRLSPAAAVLITALLFAALHLSPWRFVPQLALGCLLGWLTVRTGSCWPAAMAHAVHNAVLVGIAAHMRGLQGLH